MDNNIKEYLTRTIKYQKSLEYIYPDGHEADKEQIEFVDIQNHFINANFHGKVDEVSELFQWIREGSEQERQFYNEVSKLGKERPELGIRLYEGYWSEFDVASLSMRQREVLGKLFASPYDWLFRNIRRRSTIRLLATGAERGYVFSAEDPEMIVKYTVSEAEPEISLLAGDLGVGPKVLEANHDYIAEEMIDLDFEATGRLLESPESLGGEAGSIFKTLHDSHITYGDVFFSLHPPQIHILSNGKKCYLIDYGGSKKADNHERDIRKTILSLEYIAETSRKWLYVRKALRGFSKTYGRRIRRYDYPRKIPQWEFS